MLPWKDWYHVTGTTYGAWLPGDSRGWKTRHHRRHIGQPGIEADPETYEGHPGMLLHARKLMPRDPVVLTSDARRLAADTMIAALHSDHLLVAILAVTDLHFHALAKVPDHNPRKWFGIAKKRSAYVLANRGLCARGGVWAVRSHCRPIESREDQLNVVNYIAAHANQHAAIWDIRNHNP